MSKLKKSVAGLSVLVLVGGGAKLAVDKMRPVEEPQKVDDKLIRVYGENQKEIAVVDMDAKKVELRNGAECREVVLSAIGYAKAISNYHEQFKRDVLNTKVLEQKQKEQKQQGPEKK